MSRSRFAINQDLSGAVNKMLQAHEREILARVQVNSPRTHAVPRSVQDADAKALVVAGDVRQAAVVELCDTIADLIEEAHTTQPADSRRLG
jgi:hypothetical protein